MWFGCMMRFVCWYGEGIFGLFLFDLWNLYGVNFVVGGVIGGVGIMFFSCFGYGLYFCMFACGWVSSPILCKVIFVFSFMARPVGRGHFIYWVFII
jgi:hypothetical protein